MTRVLLVEDNEMNRDMLSRRLRKKGYEVEMAIDGPAALEAAKTCNPDVVLMDLRLPIMDGWEVTRELRNSPATASLRIIALTAHAMEGDEAKAMEAGCDDYDTKPINFVRLLEKIEHQLARTD